ncbi:MAG: hypothetical protein RBR09_07030 [Desulfobulbaceae bacterium]|jgi:hypothetical protein|nr:hypothetical protein [Desulfobulbaceae bacterium]
MSPDDEIRFLPYDEAVRLVAAIQEEESIDRPNHRILTVYNHADREICWFDFDEVMQAVAPVDKTNEKEVVCQYILNHIPDWAPEI